LLRLGWLHKYSFNVILFQIPIDQSGLITVPAQTFPLSVMHKVDIST
jgi:hypothetical protein